MKFGLFYQLPCDSGQSEPGRYQDTIEQIIHADQLGFDTAWLAELHFFRQFSIMPGPLYLATAIAQRTRNIRFGTGVTLLPFHHPLRAAEEAAVVDILTGGRLDYGVGRGTIAVHFQGYDVPREESRPRFEEALEIIVKAWTLERFSHEGKYFRFPEIAVAPKPLQRPHPPIRIAANSGETAEFAGLKGYDVLVASAINPIPGLYGHVRKYRDAYARAGHGSAGDVAAGFFVFPGEHRTGVRSQYETSLMHYFHTIGEQARLGGRSQYEGSYQYLRQVRERAMRMTYEEVESTMAVFGHPEECLERIEELYRNSGLGQLVCWFNPGGLVAHREVMAAMELFAAKVMPLARRLGVSA
jgi:alkanesulfonate monooxygenase SsuD/methylene tetrahydromethanopterin reductase-like flavin-dependent oxidoreductase (luciferase family)